MNRTRNYLLLALLLLSSLGLEAKKKPNFVIIAIDDLRTELNCYGSEGTISPHIDALAQGGIRFDRAYCQQSVCMPSRASVMSGTLPTTSGIIAKNGGNQELQGKILTQMLTFPQYLRENGYNSLSVGKIFHTDKASDSDAWTRRLKPSGSGYLLQKNRERESEFKKGRAKGIPAWKMRRGDSVEMADVSEEEYLDYGVATGAVRLIREYGDKDEPFLLAVGFFKPHLPFAAPKKYWDLYDRDAIAVPSREEPEGVSPFSLVPSWYEMRHYGDIPKHDKILNDAKTKELIHGYRACVSFIDAQIGRVMKELKAQGLDDNTYIILWSDHGFKLGEYGDWSKYTNMELDARVPFIVAGPGVPRGKSSKALVELVDIYPTLCELSDLPVPDEVEGRSLLPQLRNPEAPARKAAFTLYDRYKPDGQGISIRTDSYRYTEWRDFETHELLASELYDLSAGSIACENLLGQAEYRKVAQEHARLIREDGRLKHLTK